MYRWLVFPELLTRTNPSDIQIKIIPIGANLFLVLIVDVCTKGWFKL